MTSVKAAWNNRAMPHASGALPVGILRTSEFDGHDFEILGDHWPFNVPLFTAPPDMQNLLQMAHDTLDDMLSGKPINKASAHLTLAEIKLKLGKASF